MNESEMSASNAGDAEGNSAPVLDVWFDFSLWDGLRSNLVMTAQSKAALFWMAVMPVVAFWLVGVHVYDGRAMSAWDIVLVVFLLFYMPAFFVWQAVQRFRLRRGQPFRYQFGEFGLRAIAQTEEFAQSWKRIQKIQRRAGFLLLFWDARCAHTLPLRELESKGVVEPILALAREHGVRVE